MSLSKALHCPHLVQQVDVHWHYQKNGTKCEKKTFVHIGQMGTGAVAPTLCAVSAWIHIVQHSLVLHLPDDHPLTVFTDTGLASGKP